jgi:hypothetical protein
MPDQGKIFGIGLAKTATSSLGKALEILGYRCIHDPYELLPGFFPDELADSPVDPDVLENHDAFAGVVGLIYRELDQACPGSRFILTVRDDDRWLKSIRGHLHPKSKATRMDAEIPLQPFVRSRMFNGHLWFEDEFADDYLRAYRDHNREVMEYFRDRPDDLLVMDVEKGDGWEKLCGFLDIDIPDAAFPWKNRRTWRRSLRRKIKHWKRRIGMA